MLGAGLRHVSGTTDDASPLFAAPLTPADQRRVARTLAVLVVALLSVAAVQLAMAMAGEAPALWLPLSLLCGAAAFWWARRRVLANDVVGGVSWGVTAGLLLTVPGTLAAEAGPVVLVGPVMFVALALPYLQGRRLTCVLVAAGLVNLVNVSIAVLVPRPAVDSSVVPVSVQHIAYASIGVALILYLLGQFSIRMADLREEEHSARFRAEGLAARMGAVLSSSPIAIGVFDVGGVIQRWNPAAEGLFDLPESEVVGKQVTDVLSGDTRMQKLVAQIQQGQIVSSREVEAGTSTMQRMLEVSAGPVLQGAEMVGFVALAADVSERKRLEGEYLQSQKMESVGLLAGGIAHDFNNLLVVILGEASLLEEDPSLPQAAHRSLGAITTASRRAADLCRQLLGFSRRQIVQPQVHDLVVLVNSVMPMLERLAGATVAVRFGRPDRPMVVRIDRAQFEQVVLNLVINARDAMPRGGDVVLSLKHDDGAIVLAVRDSGTGLPEALHQKVFEPFFTTKSDGRGTGLGLSTVATIVKSGGGSVSVSSPEGEGATFSVRFPEVTAPPTVPLVAKQGKSRSVLVVEDDPSVRNAVGMMLRVAGYVPILVEDGQEALKQLKDGLVLAAMVTDVVMPVMNGRVLAEQATRLRPGLPIVFMSGFTTDAALATQVAQGEVEFLQKPFASGDLRAALERAIARQQAL